MYDFLLINCHRQREVLNGLFCDWLGIYSLATFLDKNGYPARAFAGYAHEVEDLLAEEIPCGVKAVGLSCDFENQQEVLQLSRHIREKYGLPVIIGGPQSIGLDVEFLLESGCLAIVHGEGELPLLCLAQYIVDSYGSLLDIPSITFVEKGHACSTMRARPIQNLDALPFIDSSLVINRSFREHTLTLLTARGCPFRCAFCYEGSNTRGVRWRSVGNAIAEIRQAFAEKPGLKYILFGDDTFTVNAKRLRKFIAALTDLRNEFDFVWFAEAHPRTIIAHPELIEGMVAAGLANMQIGVESGNLETLRAYNKKTDPDLLREAVSICKQSGVPHLTANIIIGGAYETAASLVQSREFALELTETGMGMLDIHPVFFWPLPNTAMTMRPEKFGLELLDANSLTSVTDYPVVRCGNVGPDQLSEAHQEFEDAVAARRKELLTQLNTEWIRKIMALSWRYPFSSAWVRECLNIDRFRRYTYLSHTGAIRHSSEIPESEIAFWHPQRTCPPKMRDGQTYAGDSPVSPELFEILKAASGRMTVEQASAYCSISAEEFLARAKDLEELLALGFCKY